MRYFVKRVLCIFMLIEILAPTAVGQEPEERIEKNFSEYSKLLSPEKLYLQTDKECYCVGDTLWFKGFLKNASEECDFVESNFIYVELFHNVISLDEVSGKYNPVLKLAARRKIKRDNGGFVGYLVIPDDFSTGKALIRGYSYWMINNAPDYMFAKEIAVTNPMKDNLKAEMIEKGVRKDADFAKYNLENPFDSLRIEERPDYDLQFMPESGRYLAGVPSRIAYKVTDNKGYGAAVTGYLYNSANRKIGIIKSNRYGFGELPVTAQSSSERYYAVIEDEKGYSKRFDFPHADEEGVAINVNMEVSESISAANGGALLDVHIARRGRFETESLNLYIVSGGNILFSQQIGMGSAGNFTIPSRELVTGTVAMVVTDSLNNILCKRALCILPYTSPTAELVFNKESYRHRERVIAKLRCKDANGKPVAAELGISVTDPNDLQYNSGNNIISEFLLRSELKGYVENPSQYFNISTPYAVRMKDVDLLMLTQGWCYYDIDAIAQGRIPAPKFGKEYIQTISGYIRGLISETKQKSLVMFTAPSIKFSAYGEVDSGYFCLKDVDFPEGTKFIVGALGGKRLNKKIYTPIIDQEIFAPFHNYKFSNNSVSYTRQYGTDAIERYYNLGGERVYNLDPVVISGRFVPKNSPSPFGNITFGPNEYKSEEDLKPYGNWDIMEYIANNFTGVRIEYTDSGKFLAGRVAPYSTEMQMGSRWQPAIVYVNKKQVSDFEYDDLFTLPVENVTSLAVLTGLRAAPFQSGALTMEYPRAVVLLNTRNPYGEKDIQPNVASTQPLGWQRPTRFYSPQYTPQQRVAGKDKRKTLYWDPYLASPEEGIEITFYNSDITNTFNVVVEGLDANGTPIYLRREL